MRFIKFVLSHRYRENLTREFIDIYNHSEDDLERAYSEKKKK